MRTVGQVLREARAEKLYSLEEVEKSIKIRKELLLALENDDYNKLPPATFVRGFIKNYSKFLGLDADKLLAIFRRDYEAKKHPEVVLESFTKPVGDRQVLLTPGRVLGVTVAIIIVGFFVYLWVQYSQFMGAPLLEIESPQDQQTVEIPTILVKGKTDPEVKVAVNNQEVGVDQSGRFQEEIKLSSSANDIIVVATSKFGQSSKVERKVFVRK